MDDFVKTYLSLTRGSNNFKESEDDVATSLAHHYSNLLSQHNIQVVIIWSTVCKNEIITFDDGTKILLWDTNYWTHFAYYYHHLHIIMDLLKDGASDVLLKLQAEAAWRDLFRVAIPRVKKNSLKHQLLFSKYYLSFGMHTTSMFPYTRESAFDIASAKWYAFMHEIAHITSSLDMSMYERILSSIFLSEKRDILKLVICKASPEDENEFTVALSERIDCVAKEVENGNFSSCQEIIADMRAMHSICSTFISVFGTDNLWMFGKLKIGITYQRSFTLRIRSIEAHLKELYRTNSQSEYTESILNSQFFQEFMLRDRLSDIIEQHMIFSTFEGMGNHSGGQALDKYLSEEAYSAEVARLIDIVIGRHLSGIDQRLEREREVTFSINTYQAMDIIDYLLAYPSENEDITFFNKPKSSWGWSGLIFDSPVTS